MTNEFHATVPAANAAIRSELYQQIGNMASWNLYDIAKYLTYLAGGATLLREVGEECFYQLMALSRRQSWCYRPGLDRERYRGSDPWEADVGAAQACCKQLLAGVREGDFYAVWRYMGFVCTEDAWWRDGVSTLASERKHREQCQEYRREWREERRQEKALEGQRQEEERRQERQRYQAEGRLRVMPAGERVQ